MPYVVSGSAVAGDVYTAAAHNVIVSNLNALGPAVFNVQQGLTRSVFTTTSTSYVDVTGLSVTITPSKSSSKILVFANIIGSVDNAGNTSLYNVLRGATSLGGTAVGSRIGAIGQITAAAGAEANQLAFACLDDPATTSATTYKVQMRVNSGTGRVNATGDDADANTRGRFVSSITVMEIPV